jgi:hypothetical protein
MSDRKFIDRLLDETLPRIQRLVTSTFEQAARDVQALDLISLSLGRPSSNEPLSPPEPEVLRSLWKPALSNVAVGLLWGVADRAVNGQFACTTEAITSVVDRIDRAELARETGIGADDLRFILREMGAALHSLVARSPTELMINRRAITLRSA